MSQEPRVETVQAGQAGQAAQTPPSVVRAEQLMTNWGHHVGSFIGMTRQRLQNAMASIRDEADRMDQPGSQSTNGASSSPTTIVQQTPAGQALVSYTHLTLPLIHPAYIPVGALPLK